MLARHGFRLVAGALAALVLGAGLTSAQGADEELRKDIETLKEGQEQILKELQELRKAVAGLTAAQPAAAPDATKVVLDLGEVPQQGDAAADLVLVEFSDYQCPFCGRFTRDTYPDIEREYVAAGKLRHAFVDLPLESIHRQAFKAAEATHCAAAQGKYWEMHVRLFANAQALEPWSAHAEALGLGVPQFSACMEAGATAAKVRAGMALAQRAGVRSTPTFMLARVEGAGRNVVRGVIFLRGAQPFANFKQEIDRALAQPSRPEGAPAPAAP